MGFLNLKEFKEELSQAVNELAEDNSAVTEEMAMSVESEDIVLQEDMQISDDQMVNTLDVDDIELGTSVEENLSYEANIDMVALSEMFGNEPQVEEEKNIKEEKNQKRNKKSKNKKEATEPKIEEKKAEETDIDRLDEEVMNVEEVKKSSRTDMSSVASDETTEITRGTVIEGNISSDGSISVLGKIKGNVSCAKKLVISGQVIGVSTAEEIYTNDAKICGDVMASGSVKVGNSSVIIGNVTGTSAVIGGAIQGDLDIQGPVIVDGTAIIQGNIKSRSVQINNGAVIEGIISQCYAEVDYNALFDKTFTE